MASSRDMIDEFIAALALEEVPVQYIVVAKILDRSGQEHIVRGSDLKKWFDGRKRHDIAETRFMLDVGQMRKDIMRDVDFIKSGLF